MKKRICPSCGQIIYGKAEQCPFCGAALADQCPYDLDKRKRAVTIGAAVGVLMLIANIGLGLALRGQIESSLKDKEVSSGSEGEYSYFGKKPKPTKSGENVDCDKMARKAVDSYNSGAYSYEEAKKKIDDLKKENTTFDTYDTMIAVLEKLHTSRECFNKAVSYEQEKAYDKAYEEYGKVINEDGKYEEAKTAKDRVKNAMVEQYKTQAKEKADGKDYDSAILIVDGAITLFPEDTSLPELKKTYETAKETAQKEKEKQFELVKGKVIKTDHIKATFQGASFTSSIKPDDTKDSYRYYKTKDSSKIWLDMKFTIKNKGKEDFDLGTMMSDMQVISKGERYFCIFGAYSSSGTNIDFVGISGVVKPGKSVTYHFIAELPKEMQSAKDSLEVKFYLDGEKQELKYR